MKAYTVRQLAQMAGVTVRTLHHYDQIGLLTPSSRTAAGYRLYGEQDLLRLQQILLYREMAVPLNEIGALLNAGDFDAVEALKEHRHRLQAQIARLIQLSKTVEKTIHKLTEDNMPLTDEELYEGFSQEQRERYQREVQERYDPKLVAESQRRVRKMSKEQWNAVKANGDEITRQMAERSGLPVEDAEVQALMARYHAHIENFYACSAEVFAGLGQLYTDNDEFRAFYERYAPGLADYMRQAMAYYAAHSLPQS